MFYCFEMSCCNEHTELPPVSTAGERIFGLSSAAEPSGLDVGENVPDDLSKVGGAQRAMLQVLTVSPGGQRHTGSQTEITRPNRTLGEM